MLRRLLQPIWVLLAVIFLIEAGLPLFPLKLVGFWLLTHEYWLSAVFTILFAKLVGVGITAFVFDVTRPKLLEMGWFERLYEFVMGLRATAAALVDPIKQRIVETLRGDGDRWS